MKSTTQTRAPNRVPTNGAVVKPSDRIVLALQVLGAVGQQGANGPAVYDIREACYRIILDCLKEV